MKKLFYFSRIVISYYRLVSFSGINLLWIKWVEIHIKLNKIMMTTLIALKTSVHFTFCWPLCGKRVNRHRVTHSHTQDLWSDGHKFKTKCFTLPLTGLMTLNKLLNSFEPPLRGFYEDKEITHNYSLPFYSLLFVINIKLFLKIKLFNNKTVYCKNHLSSFFHIAFKCLLFIHVWICHILVKSRGVDYFWKML